MWPNVMQYPYAMQNQTNYFGNMYNTQMCFNQYNTGIYPQMTSAQNTTNIYNNYIMAQQLPTMQQTSVLPSIYQQYPATFAASGLSGGMDLMSVIMMLMQFLLTQPVVGEEIVEEEIIEETSYWGDPHFKFKDKTGKSVTIDHKGTNGETYDVLNADGLDIDAEYKHWSGSAPQVMGAVRVNAGGQELLLNKGKVTLDGEVLKAGTTQKLADGRTIKVQANGSVIINTKNGKGSINIKNNNGYYDVNTAGQVGVNTAQDKGGIMGFLATQGKDKTKAEILAQYDTNKNGIIDNGDGNLNDIFKANKDIGLY